MINIKKEKEPFSEEELDFLNEMFSIGAGNAVTAMSQLFGCGVDIDIPKITIMRVNEIWETRYYEEKYMLCTITKMKLFGSIIGNLFFIIPDEFTQPLFEFMENTVFKKSKPEITNLEDWHNSMLTEMGNVLAGTYLGAISRFCSMSITHTIPILKHDRLYTFLENFIMEEEVQIIDLFLMIENRFTMENNSFDGVMIIILNKDIIQTLRGALRDAKKELRKKV